MTRFTLHLPLYLNDGTPVGDDYIATVEDAILRRAGAFTRVEAIGAWRAADGTVYREPVALFHIDSDSIEAGKALHDLAEAVQHGLAQDAVYLTQQPIAASLVTA